MTLTISVRQKSGSLTVWEILADGVVIGEVRDGEGTTDTPYVAATLAEATSMHRRRGKAATAVISAYLDSLDAEGGDGDGGDDGDGV